MSSFIGLSAADEAAALRSDVQLATTRPIPTTQVPAVGDLAFYGESFQTFMNGNLPGQQEQQQMQQHGSGQPLADTQDAEDPEDRKRRRVTRACDICWKKKIKCLNDSQSACIHCRSNGFTCTYFRDAKRRGPKALNPFEKAVAATGTLQAKQDVVVSIQKQLSLLEHEVVPTDWNLIDLYYTYLYPVQPVIPKSVFVNNVMNESPILLLAMYASASRYHHVNQPSVSKEVIFAEGIKYYKQARNMMDRYLDRPSLQTILALRLLGNFAISTGEIHMARIFFSMAITQAKDLALNEPSSSAVRLCPYMTPVQENEIKRRLWWSCFVIDMKSSSAAKRPCSIAYSMCRTPLPQPDATLETPSLRLTPEDEHSQIIAITSNAFVTPQFPLQGEQAHMLSLLRLFRRIHEFHLDWELSLSKTPEELGRRQMLISQLDQSLMNWFECLPPNFKNFTNAHFEASRSVPTMPWAALFLHLLYQTCVVVLHKDLVKKLGHLIKQKKSLAVAVSESGVMTCLLSLQSVTSLLHMTLSVNPELLYIPAYAGYCTHQTGLIHLDVIKEAPGTSLSIQHVSYLDIHIEALEALGKFWITPGSRMAESLSEHRQKLQTTPISTTFP